MGQPCTAVCQAQHRQCAVEHFASLNDCNVLREHFACEAGCDAEGGAEHPAYVVAGAPKVQRPTVCMTNDATVLPFSCEGQEVNSVRLCPCALATSQSA